MKFNKIKIQEEIDPKLKNEENVNLTDYENSKFIEPNINIENKNNNFIMNNKKLSIKFIFIILLLIVCILNNENSSNVEQIKRRRFNEGRRGEKNNKNIKEYYAQLITSEKLLWKNNTEVNLTKISEEIGRYQKMRPTFNNKEELYKRENPKISLIMTVHNQEKFIEKIYTCIEQQSLKDIEMIFVDDFSTDNSSQYIKELMKIDKRIVYIKNEENKGAFYSRNKGVLNAKGEYILLVDIDDYLLNDILFKSYETAKLYNLDIVRFYVIVGDFKKNVFWKVLKYKNGIIRNNHQVKKVFFKGTTRNTWDKLIKREVYIKSIEFMNEKFKSDKYVVFNDDVAIFGLFNVANSYGFLEEVGYIYNWAVPNSTTHIYEDIKYTNDIFKSCFTIMEYFYEQTQNNTLEKRAGYAFFEKKAYNICIKAMQYLTKGFDYIIKILDLYLNSEYYIDSQKKNLQTFKDEVIKQMSTKNNNITNIQTL